jgi:enamine deaminase RidA (YjgF/YER057c/UK114 family)
VAGQVPLDGDRNLVGPGDVRAQTRQCLANLFTLVELHAFARSDIRRLTVHVVGDHPDLVDSWAEVVAGFDRDVPPATLLGATRLGHPGQLVEIDGDIVRA